LTQEGIQQLAALPRLKKLKLQGNLDVNYETQRKLAGVSIDDGSWRRSRRSLAVPADSIRLKDPGGESEKAAVEGDAATPGPL
jgi:hypothetical protein